jgi:hypothetical protein
VKLEDVGALIDEADGIGELKVSLLEAISNYYVKAANQPKVEAVKKKTVSAPKTDA